VFDLVTGQVAGHGERDQGEARRAGGHHDRREPLLGAAQHQSRSEGHALLPFQVLEVAEHQDPVPGGDSEDRQEPDERSQREDAVTELDGEHPAHERHRQEQEREHRKPQAAEGRLEQQEDRDRGTYTEQEQPILRGI